MARLFKKKEGQATYTAGTQARVELSRNYHMEHLLVKLSVTHTNASASFKDEDLFALINQIEIVANGNENIKQVPASKLKLNNIIASGMDGLNSIVTADGAGKESYVWAIVPFSMPNTIRPHDTILNSGIFNTLDLLVNWGSDATIGTGVTVTAATLDVYSSSLVGYKRNADETIKYFKETSLVEEITSSTSEYTIKLPVNKQYKNISIASTVNGVRNDDVINRVKIKSGTTIFADYDWDAVRAENNIQFRPETTDSLLGLGVIDFAPRGRLSDMLNTLAGSGFNTLEVVLDVTKQTGTNQVYVLSDTVEVTNALEA